MHPLVATSLRVVFQVQDSWKWCSRVVAHMSLALLLLRLLLADVLKRGGVIGAAAVGILLLRT